MQYIPVKSSKKNCLIIIIMVGLLYFLENWFLTGVLGELISSQMIISVVWVFISLYIWKLPRVRSKAKLKLMGSVYGWAFVFGIVFVIASFLAGLIDGLGKSPYDQSLRGMVINIVVVGLTLVGRELVRNYLVNSYSKGENYVVFIVIALLLTLSSISFNRIMELKNLEDIVIFVAKYFAPEVSHNLLAAYLAYLGGPIASIIYVGVIKGFHWFSPILPDLQWLTTALIGVMCPIFSLTIMQGIYLKEARKLKKHDKEEGMLSWIITSLISIGIIWFSVGVFPIYPSVIATGSMEPMIKPGDVILVKKVIDMEDINSLKIGDIIQFRRDNILISHRIIDIKVSKEEGTSFQTKGDNNSSPDSELVKPEDVKGTIVKVVPKIGWPTLLIKSKKDVPMENVVF